MYWRFLLLTKREIQKNLVIERELDKLKASMVQVQDKSRVIETLSKQLESCTMELENSRLEISEWRGKFENLGPTLQAHQEIITQTQQVVKDNEILRNQITTLQQIVDGFDKENGHNDCLEKINNGILEFRQLEEKYLDLKRQFGIEQEKVFNSEIEYRLLDEKYLELKRLYDETQDQLGLFESDYRQLDEKLIDSNKLLKVSNDQNESSTRKTHDLQNKLDESNTRLNEVDLDNKRLEQELFNLKQDFIQKKDEFDKQVELTRRESTELQESASSLLLKTRQELSDLELKHSKCQETRQELSDLELKHLKCQETASSITTITNECLELKIKLSESVELNSKLIESREINVQELNGRIKDLEDELESVLEKSNSKIKETGLVVGRKESLSGAYVKSILFIGVVVGSMFLAMMWQGVGYSF